MIRRNFKNLTKIKPLIVMCLREFRIYLADIMESIGGIETYAKSGRESFFHSTLIQDGIVRNLEIIGEAANQLDDAFHAAHPEVEWRRMISLRNLIIHQYHRIDLNLIWRVVVKDVPELKEHIMAIIESLVRHDRKEV